MEVSQEGKKFSLAGARVGLGSGAGVRGGLLGTDPLRHPPT